MEPGDWDIIVVNVPYSKKDTIIERLYGFNKPFAVLLLLNCLQGKKRYRFFKQRIQLFAFDGRIGLHHQQSMEKEVEGTPFASAFFCRDVLPSVLILEHLKMD